MKQITLRLPDGAWLNFNELNSMICNILKVHGQRMHLAQIISLPSLNVVVGCLKWFCVLIDNVTITLVQRFVFHWFSPATHFIEIEEVPT